MRILTWHVHGNYLYYLSHIRHQLLLPVRPGRPEGYAGRAGTLPWPDNLIEIPAHRVRDEPVDLVLFQSRRNYQEDQFEILSDAQRALPRIYLEHDPPREAPTGCRHPAAGDDVLIVHVTHFNDLMWESGGTPTRVIEHGVVVPRDVRWTGELERGLVIINGLVWRGARLGSDVFDRVRAEVPLDLIGMGSEAMGGLGEVQHPALPAFQARYRFLFNPIRYTSLGLAVCEAMSLGVPIVGLATTEMATVIVNGVSGYVDTNVAALVRRMRELLADHGTAARLGAGAQAAAAARFGIDRFVEQWESALQETAGAARSWSHRAKGEIA